MPLSGIPISRIRIKRANTDLIDFVDHLLELAETQAQKACSCIVCCKTNQQLNCPSLPLMKTQTERLMHEAAHIICVYNAIVNADEEGIDWNAQISRSTKREADLEMEFKGAVLEAQVRNDEWEGECEGPEKECPKELALWTFAAVNYGMDLDKDLPLGLGKPEE